MPIGEGLLTVILIVLLLKWLVFAPDSSDTLLKGLFLLGWLLNVEVCRLQGEGVYAVKVSIGISHHGGVK